MKRILLVEDEVIIARSERNLLVSMGYTDVEIITSGQKAVDEVTSIKPDLILMDIRLKGEMDGIAAAGAIRKKCLAPVVFVSSHSDEETLERAKKVLPYGFLTKPFTPEALSSAIEMAFYKYDIDVKNQRLSKQIMQQVANAESIYTISKRLSSKLELKALFAEIVDSINSIFGYQGVMLLMLNEEGKTLQLQAIAGDYVDVFPEDLRIEMGEGMIGMAARTGKAQLTDDVTRNIHYVRKVGETTKSELSIPIMNGSKVIGVLDLQSNVINTFNNDDTGLLKILASQIAVAIKNALLYAEMKKDLIKRKHAEEQVNRTQIELIQILNTTAEGIRVIDRDLTMKRVNRTFLEMLDMKEENVIGRKCHQVLSCSLCHTMNCPLFQFNTNMGRKEHELRMNLLDEKQFDVLLHMSPYRNYEGKLIGIVESIRDVTASKQLETQLMHAQKLESIGQLAAGIAHEINTPTQYVSDNTRFLKEAFEDILGLYVKYQQFLHIAQNSNIDKGIIDELNKSVEDADIMYLLDEVPSAIDQSLEGISRISHIVRAMKEFSHPGVKGKSRVDINKAIETTTTIARNEWKYVADLETEFYPDLPLVPCFANEFNQVILNLITNASHAIEKMLGKGSTDKGKIKISTHLKDKNVEIKIADSGTGIPLDIQSKVFDPFFTTKEVGRGTGQGLSISYDVIVKKHNGTLAFETEENKGTTFIITLPCDG